MKIAIAGAGKLGTKVISSLVGGNHSITVFDTDESVLDRITQQYDVMTVVGNAKDISLLEENEISGFDFLIATADSDELNILIASFAKQLGCKRVIARVRDPEYTNHIDLIKEHFNIDYIVNPDLAITTEIYKYLVQKYTVTNGIFSMGKVSLLQFNARKLHSIVGLPMTAVAPLIPGMLVAAISRNGKIMIPHGSTVIEENDSLYLIGERSRMHELHKKVHEHGKYTNLQKVMIAGGGKTGYYLADKLSDSGIAVKIIERDKSRCFYLSTHLDDVMILHGDATDIRLLEEENFSDMDAFVAVTGFDEENLLLALNAKQKGIEDVISKVSRTGYKELIEKIGIDMALNPLDIVAGMITRYVQGEKKIASSLTIQGQAEIIEVIASDDMKIINTPLKDMDIPKSIIIGAIHRGNSVIIPNGDTEIKRDDRISVFYLLSDVDELEKLLASKRSRLI